MVVNAHIDTWRRWGRRERPFPEPRGSGGDDPAAGGSERGAVWELCAALPVRQRAAVVQRFYEDLDYAEIAQVLDVSEATARSHVSRARTSLRSALTEEDRDG
jgi:DNA-directed RNA polymerase specialized sigma24 family protein